MMADSSASAQNSKDADSTVERRPVPNEQQPGHQSFRRYGALAVSIVVLLTMMF